MIVRHSQGNYEIEFCSLSSALHSIPDGAQFVTDSNVYDLYSKQLGERETQVVAPGESSKSLVTWGALQSGLAARRAGRRTTLVAFGGGVIGDLAGFAAAAYMRGIPFVQIPTTLLSQVDSSVGGKVGIDLPEGKNLVGAFYPPRKVFICDETLDTLPEAEFRNGMAEVWKYGFILDAEFVDLLQHGRLDRQDIVRRCIDMKKQVVEADEFETSGERAKLNFGHTVGHALEKITGYGPLRHGEAISIGMVAEAAIGETLGITSAGVREVVEDCLRSQGLPTSSLVLTNLEMLIDAMRSDKKSQDGRLAFSLLKTVGSCVLIEDVPESAVRSALSQR